MCCYIFTLQKAHRTIFIPVHMHKNINLIICVCQLNFCYCVQLYNYLPFL